MHNRMLTTHGPRIERTTKLVQLTDQAQHVFCLWIAALMITLV
ncbi:MULTISPECIES: hypothetical protein [Streptomyces]